MGQVWLDLLFAHWRVEPEALERVVPPQLPLDRFDGSAWIGVSPFVVRGLRLRRFPPPPLLSAFPEINVRTYVTVQGKPGIYFLSLDADSRSAVFTARRTYRLPYFRSKIAVDRSGDEVSYRAERISDDGPPAAFDAVYEPAGRPEPASPGSLEHFLAERYCLYTLDDQRRIQRADIHHSPWPLRRAEAEIRRNTMAEPYGIALEGEPLLHFSARQDVALWTIAPVAG
jgi:uncharacterized protein YqjF (DUF2071 family)